MIALVQRVSRASVTIDGLEVARIGPGLLVLLGIHNNDAEDELDWVARKTANLRVFADEDGRMNRSVGDVDGEICVVSQFTLYGDVSRGNRPSFVDSARPDEAIPLYERFIRRLSELTGKSVASGRFGAMMDVDLTNDGPVTIWIERPPAG